MVHASDVTHVRRGLFTLTALRLCAASSALRVAIKPARLALSLGHTVKSMQARSAAGRAIVAEVETGVAPPKSYERTIKIRKATIETRIGVRFGLHPETKQVIITELYSGYPAHDCGNLFVGDVVTKINKVLVTDVDMASQLVKMTEGEVPPLPDAIVQPMPPVFRLAATGTAAGLDQDTYLETLAAIDRGLDHLRRRQDPRGVWMAEDVATPTD